MQTFDEVILLYSILAMLIVAGPMATAETRRQRLLTISLALLMIAAADPDQG